MTEELTLFDLGVEETKESKKVSEPTKKTDIASKIAAAVKKVEPKPELKVNDEWTIHFATEEFKISDFLEEILEEGVTLEEVRMGMERHFAQFSAARTSWDIDEDNKRLFPDAFAGSKGASPLRSPFLSSMEETLQYNRSYVISNTGKVFKVCRSLFGEMVTEMKELPELNTVQEGFKYNLPKIPASTLAQILSFFKSYTQKGSFEVMIRIYWDMELNEYVLECPKQTVSRIRIDCQFSPQYTGRNSLRYLPVLEIHSHNTMPAYFSETDNADEQRFGLYAVVGRLDKSPQILLRAKSNEQSVTVLLTDVFETDFNSIEKSYPLEWESNVTIRGKQ
ncbi:Mov34/MPN/PAD-1 family protein [Viridibacillus arvi]|uniref:Mov34/MPN/PAD-1 family protein n=1 Tax=Viridibacillus arvi TaxID=263475 RepID=UPI0034CD3BE2